MSGYCHGESERGTPAYLSQVARFGFDFSLFRLYSLYAAEKLYILIHSRRADCRDDYILHRTRRGLCAPPDHDVERQVIAG